MEQIQNLKAGDYFKRKEGAKEIYSRGKYNQSMKAYSCTAESDFCKEIFVKKNKEVFINFEY